MPNAEHQQRVYNAVQAKTAAPDFSGYDLSEMRFSSVRLDGAILRNVNLQRADLSGGYFRGCDLRGADCSKTRITTSDFRDADLSGANLTSADWTGAVLIGANLSGANLTKAKLVKARLDGVNFAGADLKGADLRGAQGLTAEQLDSAKNGDKAVLDERMLKSLGRTGDATIARHGKPTRKGAAPLQIDLLFTDVKPSFGDVFLLTGDEHPKFPPTGDYGFAALANLKIEQVDDYFAVCVEGDPAVWIYPLVSGKVVEHHPGPFDGLRIAAADKEFKKLWTRCVTRLETELRLPLTR